MSTLTARRHSRKSFALGIARFLLCALTFLVGTTSNAVAQTLVVEGPVGSPLPTITPSFTLRAVGIPDSLRGRLIFTLVITRNPSGEGPFIETMSATSQDTVVTLRVSRPLPNAGGSEPLIVYWKGRLTLSDGRVIETNLNQREVPRWLTLLKPDPEKNDRFNTTRRPRFIWSSAAIDPSFGAWVYDLQITNNGLIEVSSRGLTDTVFTPTADLQANDKYSWQVVARLTSGDQTTVQSKTTFGIDDPSLPTTTLLYQNFPNPFPSSTSFETCFWFDVRVGGARVSLDILDTRGSLVKRILAPTDLPAGIYGRGAEGSGSNCNSQYVWNGTATDGRSVPGGVYLARFTATGSPTFFKKVVFRGR